MRSLVIGVGAALTLATAWALPASLGVAIAGVVASALLVACGQGRIEPRGLVWGALAGLALLGPTRYSLLGGALFVFGIYGPRMLRARFRVDGVAIGALALAGGALMAWLRHEYAGAGVVHAHAALVVGAIAAGAAALIRIDDPIAYRIRLAARRTRGRGRVRLLRALSLRRRASLPEGPRAVRDALAAGWSGLAELADAGELDRIELRVRALENAHAAAERLEEARRCIEAGPDQVREAHERLAQELAAFEDIAAAA